jgi:hypothetical protein
MNANVVINVLVKTVLHTPKKRNLVAVKVGCKRKA